MAVSVPVSSCHPAVAAGLVVLGGQLRVVGPSCSFHPSERLPCSAGHMPGDPDGASPQEGIW
jgi:hypothetical protein